MTVFKAVVPVCTPSVCVCLSLCLYVCAHTCIGISSLYNNWRPGSHQYCSQSPVPSRKASEPSILVSAGSEGPQASRAVGEGQGRPPCCPSLLYWMKHELFTRGPVGWMERAPGGGSHGSQILRSNEITFIF